MTPAILTKISFVTKSRMPEERGVGFAVAAKCRSYKELGADVELVSPDRRQLSHLEKIGFWQYFQIPANFYRVKRLFCWEPPEIRFLEFILSHFRYSIMSWSFSIASLYHLWKHNRMVVQFYSECSELLFLLRLVQYFYRPEVICEVHFPPNEPYGELMELLSLERADKIVLINSCLLRFYTRKKLLISKMIVRPEGVRLEDFNYADSKLSLHEKLRLPDGKVIIGYGGRFVTAKMEKGIPELLRATKILFKKYHNIFLICVGGPQEYVDKYKTLAHELRISDKVLILNHVPPKTLYEYMRAFDICVLPFPWTEHFAYNMSPLKMFESMASKNPIVASDLPSIREVLEHGQTAWLVPPGDPNALAKGIERLIKDKKLRIKLSRNAFELVSRKYTWRHRAAKILGKISEDEVDRYLKT